MTEPRFPQDDREPPELDHVTAERLLDGRLDRQSAPPDYSAVLDLLDAARGPATATERAGEAAAVASFRACHRDPSRRPRVLSKVLTIKAAVVAASALSVAGVAAAATGALPGTGGRPTLGAAAQSTAAESAAGGSTAVDRTGRMALCEAAARRGGAGEAAPAAAALARLAGGPAAVEAYCAQVGSTTKPDATADRGPDAAGAARAGLCRAVAAGSGEEWGGKESAAAFEALAIAAGGADNVEAYCAAPVGSGAADRAAGGKPSTRPSAGPTGTPSHPGQPESVPGGGRPTAPPATVPSPSRQGGRP